jgi:hypothetical protein
MPPLTEFKFKNGRIEITIMSYSYEEAISALKFTVMNPEDFL